jgi:hypothetical protein
MSPRRHVLQPSTDSSQRMILRPAPARMHSKWRSHPTFPRSAGVHLLPARARLCLG